MKKLFTLLLSALSVICFTNSHAQTGYINTIAGNGVDAFWGDGGPATSAEIWLDYGMCVDKSGNIYLGEWQNHVIREITYSTGIINTIAGNGNLSYSGDGVPATSAAIWSPVGIALDASGNLYLNDEFQNRVRKVTMSTGIITTVIGNGNQGFYGDGGQATAAEISSPYGGILIDATGNIYLGDYGNDCIRKVGTTGIITTIAGIGTIGGYYGDGSQATSAELNSPSYMRFDASGNIFFSDNGNNVVRKITTSGVITTVVGNGTAGYHGDGGQATSAELNDPEDVNFDSQGNIYIADAGNNVLRMVTTSTGIISTIAGNGTPGYNGDGIPATSAEMYHTNLVDFTLSGNILVGDDLNYRIREITLTTTGINENHSNEDGFILYPNPASNIAYLSSENGIKSGTNLYLFDISGKEVWKENISNSEKIIPINAANLSNGVYMLSIVNVDGSSVIKKLVIIK